MLIAPNGQEDLLCVLEDMGMRRVVGLFLAVMFMLLTPTFVPAEGLFGLGIPWGSSWGQAPGSCCSPGAYYGAWGKCCPAVYVGYEIQQGSDRKPLNLSLDLTTAAHALSGQNVLFGQQLNTDFSDPGGLWLGVSNYCQCSDRVGILASGWYLFPSSGDAQETYFNGLGILGSEQATFGSGRTWSTTRSWGWIDGAVILGSPCGLNLIAGFRWDSYSIKLRDPSPFASNTILFPIGTSSDEADLTLNSYIPLIGTQCCWGGPCCGLLFRVVGFPWVPGNLRYGETINERIGTRLQVNGNYDRGSFLEIFSEYSRTCPGVGCLGIFARWNYLDVRGSTSPEILGPVTLRFGPIRTSWTVGGRLALNFDMPF